MRPYNPYTNYMQGYNPCMQASPYYSQIMHEGGAPATCPPGTAPYTVMEGDTLYSIARMYGTSVQDIMAANPSITDMNMIFTGQLLCVPAAMPTPPPPMPRPCPTGTMSYTVVQGDTLASIADRFSVSVYALTVANPGFTSDNLTPGMMLCIAPFACAPSCVESERYTIGAGEDLMSVAKKFGISPDDLLKANPFAPPCQFAPGNMICLTSAATVPPAPKPPSPNISPSPIPPMPNISPAPIVSPMPNISPAPIVSPAPNVSPAPIVSPAPSMPNRPNAPNSQRTRR